MNFADIAIRRPVFTVMMSLALMVLGVMSLGRLGVDLFPDINFPIVAVTTVYPGAGPEEVERLVTRPIEDSVASITGLDRIKSFSRDSISTVVVQFKLEADIKQGSMDVREKIASIRGKLPRDVEDPIVNRVDVGAAPIMLYTVSSDDPPEKTRELTEDIIKPALETIDGVAAVNVNGGREREIQVNLSSAKLQSLNLSPTTIAQVLGAENLDIPSGRITADGQEISVQARGQFASVSEIGEIILPIPGGAPVMLKEVAEIVDGFKEQRLRNRVNGTPAVVFEVIKQSGTNTLSITEQVAKKLQRLESRIPDGYTVTKLLDASMFIEENTHEVEIAIVFGGAMAILIIFLFMLDWRSTLISALALPTSVVATFWVMDMMGFSLNMMSLLALSLAIGLLIDDAVVVRENIFRHMELGEDPMTAASRGTSEIALAVMATTFTIVAVFVPVGFTGGMIGQFFRQFGLTVAAAVLVSLFVAFTLDPMLSARLVKPIEPDRHERERQHWFKGPILRTLDSMDQAYRETLAWCLKHRALVTLAATLLFFGSLFLTRYLGMEFMPKPDRGQFQVNMELPAGSSIDYADDVVRRAEGIISENPYVVTRYSSIGIQNDPTKASIRILCTDKNSRPMTLVQIMQDLRVKLSAIPDLKVTMTDIGFIDGMVEAPLQLNVRGEDYALLLPLAQKVRDIVRKVPGSADVDMTYSPGKPELKVKLDRARAGTLGVNMATLGLGLRNAIEGDTTSKFRAGDKEYSIRVRMREQDRSSVDLLNSFTVPNRAGLQVKLSELVRFEPGVGPSQIERENRQRQITITGNVYGRTLGEVVNDVNRELAKLEKPEGYSMTFSGEAERMADSVKSLGLALLLGIIFIYIVLASQFESFIHPFTIMFSLPLAIVGALLSLFITGYSLGLSTFIGIILLMGLVTKNAILLVDYTNQLRDERDLDIISALLVAGPTRLRPILMTSAAMVLGMLPTAISTGSGSEFRAPMAIAVIGGVITSTLLTLVVVPVVYTFLDRLTLRGRRERRAAGSGRGAGSARQAAAAAAILLISIWALCTPGNVMAQALNAQQQPSSLLELSDNALPQPWGDIRLISLKEAYHLALENSPDIRIAQSRLDQSKLLMGRAYAMLQPIITAGGQYTRNSEEIELNFGDLALLGVAYTDYQFATHGMPPTSIEGTDFEEAFDALDESIVVQPLDAWAIQASMNWGILNARTIPLFQAAKASTRAAELATDHIKRELLYGVAQLYLNLYALQEVVAVSQRLLESRQRHLQLARGRQLAGQATASEVVRAEVDVAQAVRQLREAHQVVHNLSADFAILIGMESVELRVQPPILATEPDSGSASSIDYALSSRRDLASSRQQLEAARSGLLDSKLEFLPTVALTASYRYTNQTGFSGSNEVLAVGAVASLPIWDGGIKMLNVMDNRQKVRQAEENLRKLEMAIKKEVQVAASNLSQARINLEAAEQELRLARFTSDQVTKLYEAGRATALELRDSQVLVSSAELGRVRSAVALDLASLQLDRATGRFTPGTQK